MPRPITPPSPVIAHTLLEDAYAMVAGVLFAVVGLTLLQKAGLVTGGTAGIALLFSYVMPQPVGVLFMLINIPFFMFGYVMMGPRFTFKSLAGSVMIMTLLDTMPRAFSIAYVNPVFAAVAGGTLCGMAVLAFARHGAGVGGTGIVSLWLQRKYGINAGRTQVAFDIVILFVALAVVSPQRVGWSTLSAFATAGMLMAWHIPGRYTGR